ncbi:hypothetical protein BDN70DRAFT_900581 [Pholiota conissans]|uniref:DUF6589 domain-containing protein n=1 Tax=Pholiota conissans TaxID=109636 RepID=A0A9P5YP11_9AGAR|nr:hypothetical protein BDN70DRAFT_900581 [Pholiota conissans]
MKGFHDGEEILVVDFIINLGRQEFSQVVGDGMKSTVIVGLLENAGQSKGRPFSDRRKLWIHLDATSTKEVSEVVDLRFVELTLLCICEKVCVAQTIKYELNLGVVLFLGSPKGKTREYDGIFAANEAVVKISSTIAGLGQRFRTTAYEVEESEQWGNNLHAHFQAQWEGMRLFSPQSVEAMSSVGIPGATPNAFILFDAFSTTKRQAKELTEKSCKRQELIRGSAILSLLQSKSQNKNYLQAVLGTYLMATGAQKQHFSAFQTLGIHISYDGIIANPSTVAAEPVKPRRIQSLGTLFLLSNACRQTAQKLASTNLFVMMYDNINMVARIAKQILGRKNAQENGTCATIVPLHGAALEDIKIDALEDSITNAKPLQLEDLYLSDAEDRLMQQIMAHTILSVVVRYGGEGFKIWEEILREHPAYNLHPLPSMKIDENTITGNIEIVEEINAELKLVPQQHEYIRFIAGDQLTIARQRSITGIRLDHEVSLNMWRHFVLITGHFHAKIVDTHGTLLTHFGVSSNRSPGSLAFHNICLHRIPIVISSLPSFRVCRDLIMVSLCARILHCLLLVSGQDGLKDYVKNVKTWEEMKLHAKEILTRFANADKVQELREPRLEFEAQQRVAALEAKKKARKKSVGIENVNIFTDINHPNPNTLPIELQGDMVFENGLLFLRDALLTRIFSSAVKSGDSDIVILVLKHWAFSYRSNGKVKYAHEMLHLPHNLINIWTKAIRRIVVTNWLLNPTGKADAFVEIDSQHFCVQFSGAQKDVTQCRYNQNWVKTHVDILVDISNIETTLVVDHVLTYTMDCGL